MIRGALRRTIERLERDGDSHTRHRIDGSPHTTGVWLRIIDLLAAAVIGGFWLAAPAAAHASVQSATVTVYTMTPERIAASTAALVGLIGAVIGGLALAGSADRIANGTGRRGAIVALVLGPIGLVIGGLVVATADGGVGTGNGVVGGAAASVLGLIALAIGRLALARCRLNPSETGRMT